MFRRIRWRLLATYLIVVSSALVFLGVHLARQFEAAFTEQLKVDLLDLARLMAINAVEGLGSGDVEAIARHLQRAHHAADSPLVMVTDAEGVIVAVQGLPEVAIGARALAHPSVPEALGGKEVTGVGAVPGSGEAVYAAVPVRTGARLLGTVHVARPLTYLHAQIQHLRWVVAWGTVVALLIATGVGLLLARSIAAPVQQMQLVAGRLAAGRLSERVPVQTRDELGDLARSLNYMASELERIDSMRRAFVADAAHELRTPVANLAVAVEALKAVLERHPDQAAPVAGDIEREVARLRRLVEDLLDLSLVDAGQVRLNLTAVSPADLLRRAAQPFQPRAERSRITLKLEIPPRLPAVKADADRTIQVLSNLLDNAFKHTSPGGTVTVGAAERRGHVLLSVADTGPGIPESELPHIFDRFYKVDKARAGGGGGAGLGLAIAKRLVEAQGGIIMVESNPGQGTRFMVALPKEG
ncbi:MAG: ATP-binding protein [Armatimonadota bacterium]|nr:ATP-binding protein [Armatimonadota bacterium]MDR7451334.1 ATP-binding protein [Armatimonadota bacterium]MDR7466762.1 ATP-binding protein [Armatimonadota bacterium]MDR7492764.1 ATP-binding protein [Armatimonadota bacterium]MDR7498540.1 ATP-binding protein [Armatimonadota bacterium]